MALPKNCCVISLFATSVVLLGVSLFLLIGLRPVIMDEVHSRLVLTSDDSELWDVFVDPAQKNVQFQRKFWFFNVTNVVEVCAGAVPIIVEIGPYVYDQHRHKYRDTIRWTDDDEQIHFKYAVDFTFNAAQSIDETTRRQLHESDPILTYNLAFYSAAFRVNDADPTIILDKGPFRIAASGDMNAATRLCVTGALPGIMQMNTVHERLWGYQDLLWRLLYARLAPQYPAYAVPTIARLQWNSSLAAPDPITPQYGQRCPMWNNMSQCKTSTNTDSTMHTGGGDYKKLGTLLAWAGHKELSWWGEGCRSLEGATDGTQFPPDIDKDDRPKVFADVAFRAIELEYESETEVKDIDTLRFGFSARSLQSSAENPDNACFHQGYHGYVNISAGIYAPVFLSKAHLLDADRSIVNISYGNEATRMMFTTTDRARDDTFFDIETTTGAPLAVRARIQLNMPVGPQEIHAPPPAQPSYNITRPLAKTMMPIAIMEESFVVSDELADDVKHSLYLIRVATILGYVFGSLFLVGFLVCVLFAVLKLRAAGGASSAQSSGGEEQQNENEMANSSVEEKATLPGEPIAEDNNTTTNNNGNNQQNNKKEATPLIVSTGEGGMQSPPAGEIALGENAASGSH